ncbi:MAG: hypothetical protein P1P88_05500 [Bacteroidales bacterium]|nr:hypothetical protein [Bacteroidales bacterium]
MIELDKNLQNLIANDELPFKADPSIQQRLNYHMQLKASRAQVKQNSLIPFLSGVFTSKLIGLKISLLTVALLFIGYRQINHPSVSFSSADTAYVSRSIDTLNFQTTFDSLSIY